MNLPDTEYNTTFDELRKNRSAVSYHKYGSAKINFGKRLVDAIKTLERCLAKYKETHNTEYLCDAANYAMFEYMYPSFDDAYFRATDSDGSAGIVGMAVKEIENLQEE